MDLKNNFDVQIVSSTMHKAENTTATDHFYWLNEYL